MKLRGSVLVNTLILFSLLLMLTVGAMQRFRDWQESYRVLEQVEKRQFTEAYNHWRTQVSDKSISEPNQSASTSQKSDTSGARSAPPRLVRAQRQLKDSLNQLNQGFTRLNKLFSIGTLVSGVSAMTSTCTHRFLGLKPY